MTFLRATLACCALVLAPGLALAATAPLAASTASAANRDAMPVVQLGVDVPPYYIAGRRYGEPPKVSLDPAVDTLLSSGKHADVLEARDAIAAKPDLVKPATMIAVAMRLYDIGQRDDAVFWFYAARGRFVTMGRVLDMRSLQLMHSAEVTETFLRAAGPALDGYAYCSIAFQAERQDRALAWVSAHPYRILGFGELPAQTEDRNAALATAIEDMRRTILERRAQLADPAEMARFDEARAVNHSHERYCWR